MRRLIGMFFVCWSLIAQQAFEWKNLGGSPLMPGGVKTTDQLKELVREDRAGFGEVKAQAARIGITDSDLAEIRLAVEQGNLQTVRIRKGDAYDRGMVFGSPKPVAKVGLVRVGFDSATAYRFELANKTVDVPQDCANIAVKSKGSVAASALVAAPPVVNVTNQHPVTVSNDHPVTVKNEHPVSFSVPPESIKITVKEDIGLVDRWLRRGYWGSSIYYNVRMPQEMTLLRREIRGLRQEFKIPGPVGPQGPQGFQGVTGQGGRDGRDGRDCDPAVFSGCRGPQGPAGAGGAQGPQGVAGPQGPQGPHGPVGHNGAPGSQGPVGSRGPSGPQGPVGPQGPQGPRGPQGPVAHVPAPPTPHCPAGWTLVGGQCKPPFTPPPNTGRP